MSETEKIEKETAEESSQETGYVEFPFPTFYTNTITLSSGPFDFSFLICDRYTVDAIAVRARIVTSPPHAKILLATLAQQIEKFEALFGEIRLPGRPSEPSTEPEPQL